MGRKPDPMKTLSPAQREDIRRRIAADVLSSAGQGSVIAREMLLTLPSEFTTAYEQLFYAALRDDKTSSAGGKRDVKAEEEIAQKVAEAESGDEGAQAWLEGLEKIHRTLRKGKGRQQAQGGGKKYRNYWLIGDSRAFSFKERVDAELATLATRILDTMERGYEGVAEQCGGCGQWLKNSWKFCPSCGGKLQR